MVEITNVPSHIFHVMDALDIAIVMDMASNDHIAADVDDWLKHSGYSHYRNGENALSL